MNNIGYRYKKPWFILDATSLICAALLMFSFWDFYYYGIGRVLDYFGIVFVLMEMFFLTKGINKLSSLVFRGDAQFLLLLSLTTVVFFSILGVFHDQILPSIAILVGVFVVFRGMLLSRIDIETLAKFLDFMIILNVVVFFIQYIVFKLSGQLLDITKMAGSIPSRVYNKGLHHFRPAGLFQEPNSYCVNLFMLMVLRQAIGSISQYIKWLFFLTLLISQSLWGIGAALLYLFLFVSSIRGRVLVFIILLLSISIFWYLGYIQDFLKHSIITARLENIDKDASRHARYGSLSSYFSWGNILGAGVNTTEFSQSLAANGIAFMIYSFGWMGSSIIMLTLSYLFYRLHRVKFLICFMFLLTTDQIMTYMIFWAWLGLLLHISFVTYNKRLINRGSGLL